MSDGIKLHGKYKQVQHVQPKDRTPLKCSQCGAEVVQHIALQDGWKAGVALAGGLAWVCSKDVCKKSAQKKGVVIQR